MKVLITGGTGFVGKAFLNEAAKQGWELVLVTRKRSNVPTLPGCTVRVYEGDVADPAIVDRIVAGEKRLDGVFHLAASLVYFAKKPDIERFNVGGTRNLLRVAQLTGAQRFVYASSIEAAGGVRADEIPAPTERGPRPISSYGWSKVQAEAAVRAAAPGKFKASILRIGNVYGTDHLNFITFIADSILNRTRVLEFLPYYEDRCIQPVHNHDVTHGLLAAYRCPADLVTATLAGEYAPVGRIFQICAETMGKRYRRNAQKQFVDHAYLYIRKNYHRYQGGGGDFITYLMAGPGRSIHRAYSLKELTDVIGYLPRYSLPEGIRDTLGWARSSGLLMY